MFQNTTSNMIIVLPHYFCHLIAKSYNQTFSCMSPEQCLPFALAGDRLLENVEKYTCPFSY